MSIRDIHNSVFQSMQGSSLTRQPTIQELDEFIDRCMKKEDINLHMLAQNLAYRLQPPNNHTVILSVYEVEIYPLVLQRIKQRIEGYV